MNQNNIMKQNLPFLLLLFLLSFACKNEVSAQSFSQVSYTDTIDNTPDTLHFFITGANAGAYGTANLKITYSGDFGDNVEFLNIYGPDGTQVGLAGPYASATDCDGEASETSQFNAALINTWLAANDTLFFTGITSQDVDLFCSEQHAFIQLSYNYCTQGRTASIANTNLTFCNFATPITLLASPDTGTFSGPGVTGNLFNPQAVAPGTYTVTYNATDSGCVSSASVNFVISAAPILSDTLACPGSAITLTAAGSGLFGWFESGGFTNLLDTGYLYTTAPVTSDTSFNISLISVLDYFQMNTATTHDSGFVDHNLVSGDDRGGVVVSSNYAYVVGDDSTARYDLDLNPASAVGLPIRDGIFANLGDGKIYSLSDGISEFDGYANQYVTMAIRLNDDLSYSSDTIHFSQAILASSNNNHSGMFSGYNTLVTYAGDANSWYAVNLLTGLVDSLGTLADPQFYYGESWADWGVAEFDGEHYSVIFRSNDGSNNLYRRVLPNGVPTLFASFNNIGQTCNFCFLPSLNRWYLHTEYDSDFNPDTNSETLAYADATAVHQDPFLPIGNCPAELTVTVKTFNAGTDIAFCAGDSATLNAGSGYTAYTWNGASTNTETFVVKQAGNVAVAVADADNCTLNDTVVVTVNALPNVTLALPFDSVCLNGAAITLTGASPAGGTFTGAGISAGVLTPSSLTAGVKQVTYSYTDNNSCTNSNTDSYEAKNCTTVGIEEIAGTLAASIYPNPSNGNFILQINTANLSSLALIVTDMQGKEVYNYQTSRVETISQLNLSALQSGMYLVNAISGNLRFNQRIVIQK